MIARTVEEPALMVAGEQHAIERITMRPQRGGLRPHVDISCRGNLQKAAVVRELAIWPRWGAHSHS